MSDFNPDYFDTPEKREIIWKVIADERAAEITRLRAELDEAIAMVNEMDAADLELVSGAEINRIEIIDQTGRIFVAHETLSDVRLSFQDDGRTLKVFCHRRP